ncbi:MAG TPA: IS200/IS605 family transposase [Aggregatilineales bacterium]|nr:IS200/IS605 family transposase [Chloroflexota bacterium]HPV06281.1 IS200/IS605 family transposase [Aggregatilineales bacterium]
MAYWRQFFHIVWATYRRQPLLSPEIEPRVHRVITALCSEQGGQAYAVNGMPDHIHMVTTIPPTLSTATFVKKLKGASSHFITHELGCPFRWEAGYGVLTISQRNLRQAIDYVNGQKQHHEAGQVFKAYELSSTKNDGPKSLRLKPASR